MLGVGVGFCSGILSGVVPRSVGRILRSLAGYAVLEIVTLLRKGRGSRG